VAWAARNFRKSSAGRAAEGSRQIGFPQCGPRAAARLNPIHLSLIQSL
jgi:hypothetical protein